MSRSATQGTYLPLASLMLVDRARKAVLDSRTTREQETDDSMRRKESYTVASHPLIERARQQGRTLLTELESKQVLHDLGIPTTLGQLATSEEDAVRAADTIGYPVVLKIASPDIVHKSDVGGVQLHLQDGAAVRQAFRAMQHRALRPMHPGRGSMALSFSRWPHQGWK